MLARWALCRPAVAASFRRFNASLAAHPDIPTGAPTSAAHAEEARFPFSDLKGVVNDRTLKALIDRPFQLTNMTVVQAAVLPLLPKLALPAESGSSDTRDLLVKAKTGTGKTLAFLIPAIEARLNQLKTVRERAADESGDASQATNYQAQRTFARKNVGTLIISPTRELASQIAVEATRLATYHDEFEVRLFVGGVSKGLQMRDWNRGRRDLVVATPGRLRDLLENERGFADSFKQVQVVWNHFMSGSSC
jgi:ATP-dependent RNA helicase MSS116